MIKNFSKYVLENGGEIFPLLINSSLTNGTGLTNPSIFKDRNKLLINLRHVEYTLYHSEKKKYCHPWGPIQYLHRENDSHLRTNNFLGELDENFCVKNYSKVDTTKHDKDPLWNFVGLEDARIVKWNKKLYLCGVRRDTTTNGQGRMELSEIVKSKNSYKEVSRFRIPSPGDDGSYCEKNWMPILDMPFHFVKWCNPTEVVKVDIENKTCETVYLGNYAPSEYDFRGGSQVIPWGEDYRICLVHQVDLFKSKSEKRDARYRHRFIVWDKDWNIVKYCEPFDFISGEVEFSAGATFHENSLLVTFGFQDNSSFLLKVPSKVLDEYIKFDSNKEEIKNFKVVDFFPYFHETGKELLELRINLLKDYVDEFIICESNRTQSGIPIDYHLEEDIKELNLPNEKIKIIKLNIPNDEDLDIQLIDKYNCSENYNFTDSKNAKNINSLRARVRERMQKDSILFVLDNYDDNTIFIHSDSDEIIDPNNINWIVDILTENRNHVIKIPLVLLEGRADLRVVYTDSGTPKPWNGGMFFATKSHLKKCTPTQIRTGVFNSLPITYPTHNGIVAEDLGWHFSWMGNKNTRKIKRQSFCHYDDTFSFLRDKSYNSKEVADIVDNSSLEEGTIPPSGDFNTVLKKYSLNNLPKQVLELERVKNFLLPSIEIKQNKETKNIVDCFPYFNEEELLELRINTLYDYVDEFLIFDSNYTFSGIPKNFTCKKTLERLNLLKDKVKVIEVDMSHLKDEKDPWLRERYPRDYLRDLFENYSPETVFIVTDCDEIIDPSQIDWYAKSARDNRNVLIKIPMVLSYGRADLRVYSKTSKKPEEWTSGYVCTKNHLRYFTPSQLREGYMRSAFLTQNGITQDAGWHFSWMGNAERRKTKCKSFAHYNDYLSHSEIDYVNSKEMESHLESYNPRDGADDPLGRRDYVLKSYPKENLPEIIFNLPRVKNYLLP